MLFRSDTAASNTKNGSEGNILEAKGSAFKRWRYMYVCKKLSWKRGGEGGGYYKRYRPEYYRQKGGRRRERGLL